ncbi:unnamed protein product [Sphenostylis stenocarpa]|uniref:Uncharacterized protein n=1 Tax=Sphenostylis stenocarpa TaxID=92480 RepID=A0AA86W517_9FABA|nr:unnamed protein product [Sphenostylis stenocarpa]
MALTCVFFNVISLTGSCHVREGWRFSLLIRRTKIVAKQRGSVCPREKERERGRRRYSRKRSSSDLQSIAIALSVSETFLTLSFSLTVIPPFRHNDFCN